MVYLSSNTGTLCFLTVIASAVCDSTRKRTEPNPDEEGNCFQAFDQCSKSDKCRAALRGLDKRCKVIAGRCSAEMVDLPRCGQIMDHVFSFGFPQERCTCSQDSKQCKAMRDKVYSNPCFTSIRHLRKNGIFPKEINAYDRVSRVKLTTTESPSTTVMPNERNGQIDQEARKMALFEEVFGDKKQAKKPLTRRTKIISFVKDNKVLRPSQGKSKALAQSNPRKEVTINPRLKAEETAQHRSADEENDEEIKLSDELEVRDTVQMRISTTQLSGDPADALEKGLTKEEATDYKSIAIILATLLGALVLSSTVFLLWARMRTPYFYTSGKFIQDQREDEIFPKSQNNFSKTLPSLNTNDAV